MKGRQGEKAGNGKQHRHDEAVGQHDEEVEGDILAGVRHIPPGNDRGVGDAGVQGQNRQHRNQAQGVQEEESVSARHGRTPKETGARPRCRPGQSGVRVQRAGANPPSLPGAPEIEAGWPARSGLDRPWGRGCRP